ncbi:MAG: class I SAM-dependent methyltransferase [Thermosipho sp. (in: Bacteria)]|nr:class I SAM-dependent methyltransferase [Thermosipho sp. (in: thermotogales)]
MDSKLYDKYLHNWIVDLYEQTVTETEDVQMIKKLIGNHPQQHILEVCCGSGRILVPLAKDGHIVTGIDIDNLMIAKLFEKTYKLENITIIQANAATIDWGKGYDVVILGGNILLNIVTEDNIKTVQQKFIQNAYHALKPGGYMYLDNNYFAHPEYFFGQPGERIIFEGTDSSGTYGRYILTNEKYDSKTQIVTGTRRFELKLKSGETFCKEETYIKYVPTIQETEQWIINAGFIIEQKYGNYEGDPISEITRRAIYWAKKPE